MMESASNRAISRDETERCLQVLNYDESNFVDELSKDVSLSMGDVDKIMEASSETPLISDTITKPYIGMEFKSREAAREFYIAYGTCKGFTVRVHHSRRSRKDSMVIGQDFVCSKEGFREKKYIGRKDRVLPPPPVTREGCHAMLRLGLRDGDKWVVTKFVEEHNHAFMSPSKVPRRGSAKSLIGEDEKDSRIRQLTVELHNERQRCKRRCAAYQERIQVLLSFVEEHTDHLSRRVEGVVKNIRELEHKELWDSDSRS